MIDRLPPALILRMQMIVIIPLLFYSQNRPFPLTSQMYRIHDVMPGVPQKASWGEISSLYTGT